MQTLGSVSLQPFMFAASNFEFKHRFWLFGALFWVAFFSYSLDHRNAGATLAESLCHVRGVPVTAAAYRAIFGIAALFCVAGAAVRTWGTAYLHAEVMVDMQLHTTRLVAEGPYRYVRNPLYLGNILVAIGFGLMASVTGFFVLVVGMILFDYRIIFREEAGMLAGQGESYREYCRAVPRLLPALRPKLPSSGKTPNWPDGLLGEAFMWLLAAAVLTFAITLKLMVFWAVLVSAFAVYGLCYTVIRKRQKKKAAGAT